MLAVPRRKARTALRLARGFAVRQRLRARPGGQRSLVRRLGAQMPVSEVVDGPLVSIVLVARSGRPIPASLSRALSRTAYRSTQVMITEAYTFPDVSDPTPEDREARNRAEADMRAAAIQAALEDARGELVCLLDPAVEPVRPDWLGHLVESVLGGAVAAGPLIVRAAGRGPVPATQHEADLTLLSAGIDFARGAGIALPRHVGVGTAPEDWAGRVLPVPILSAACLVTRREDLLRAGVPGDYRYDGVESGPGAAPLFDADLALRLRRRGGTIVCDGRAAVLYRTGEGPRLPTLARPARRSEPAPDPELDTFLDRWGPRAGREVLLDVISGRHEWSIRPLSMLVWGDDPAAVILPGGAPEGLDWRIERRFDRPPGDAADPFATTDVIIGAGPLIDARHAPTGLIRVAWIADREGAPDDLPEYDLIVAADPADAARAEAATGVPVIVADLRLPAAADRLAHALLEWAGAPRLGIRIGVPRWDVAESWGDYSFARAIQRELERDGFPTRVHLRPAWSTPASARDDASLHIFGLKEAPTRPSQVNLLWQISHPDLASGELYDRYDAAFVASDRFADRMAGVTAIPVRSLHQATDPELMSPDRSGPHHELLFVANSRNVRRTIVDYLADTGHDLAIYGKSWTSALVDPRFVRGERVPPRELARYYSSADIVLNDHWQDMRAEGFISNRIYDALACGAFVISDHVDEIADEFDGAVPTFRDKEELDALIERYLADPDGRRRMAEHGRSVVLERHTFRHRADVLVRDLRLLLAGRPTRVIEVEP
jgi:hypothetical protein